jgi:hypothetical protein
MISENTPNDQGNAVQVQPAKSTPSGRNQHHAAKDWHCFDFYIQQGWRYFETYNRPSTSSKMSCYRGKVMATGHLIDSSKVLLHQIDTSVELDNLEVGHATQLGREEPMDQLESEVGLCMHLHPSWLSMEEVVDWQHASLNPMTMIHYHHPNPNCACNLPWCHLVRWLLKHLAQCSVLSET